MTLEKGTATFVYPTLRKEREGWGTRAFVSRDHSRGWAPGGGRTADRSHLKSTIPIANSPVSHSPPLVIPTEAYPDFLLRAASEATGLDRKFGGAKWRDLQFSPRNRSLLLEICFVAEPAIALSWGSAAGEEQSLRFGRNDKGRVVTYLRSRDWDVWILGHSRGMTSTPTFKLCLAPPRSTPRMGLTSL